MPYFANEEVGAYGREHGIATEAWSPIEPKAKQHCVFHANLIAVGQQRRRRPAAPMARPLLRSSLRVMMQIGHRPSSPRSMCEFAL
jgi:diketogulonate reductase-like aldo/keto reductase